MRRPMMIAVVLIASSQGARAQMMYPGGYGGYGLSQWGADPAAGYMAGLGSYARGQGVYEVDKAKADTINLETMLKWNKALRARQKALREEHAKEAAQSAAARDARVARLDVQDGTTLNDLLLQILDSDPGAVKSAHTRTPLSPAAIREIPFEWDSEAITLCVDQMTGSDSLPDLLRGAAYADDRQALRTAVESALHEDAKGNVSPETRKLLVDAIGKFRADFVKNASNLDLGYQDAHDYLTTLASLSRLLNDPSMKAFLSQLDNGRQRTVGDLVAFMNAFNLRFGPATTDRQLGIYRTLVPPLRELRDVAVKSGSPPSTPDRTGEPLKTASKTAFKSMSWAHLEAHARGQ